MNGLELVESFTVLREELARGEDINETPALIHNAVESVGDQSFLFGQPQAVEAFFAKLPVNKEPRIAFEWLRISMMYANDVSVGLRALAGGWAGSANLYKAYVALGLAEFSWG